jgi:hypothetical protein
MEYSLEPKKSNWWKIILGVILLLAILAFAIYYFLIRVSNTSRNDDLGLHPTPSVTTSPTTAATSTPTTSITTKPTSAVTTITPAASVTPTSVSSDTPAPTLEIAAAVKVFFSVDPESTNDFTYAEYRVKNTKRSDVGTFAIEQTIAGPTTAQASDGLFNPIKLSGDSNCSGKDFTLSIDDAKKATLKFCKTVESAGVGDDARMKNVITYDLKQFPTVEKVVILTKDGNCLGDLSGQNLCKN